MKEQKLKPNVYEFDGFTKGVIGKKLPSDSTMLNMKKKELIELLYIAQHNYESLMFAYNNATSLNIEELAKLQKYNWTSCDCTLPKKEYEMLWTTHEDGSVVMHGYSKKHGFIYNWEVDDLEKRKKQGDVIAWMPIDIPKPYEE